MQKLLALVLLISPLCCLAQTTDDSPVKFAFYSSSWGESAGFIFPSTSKAESVGRFSIPTIQTLVGYSRMNWATCNMAIPINGYNTIGMTATVNSVLRSRN